MFVLPVALAMITNNPVGISRRVRFRVGRVDFSVQIVVQSLEETFAQVHVSNGVNAFWELNGARNLSVPVAPVVFNAFHVPLVDEHDNLLAGLRGSVYFLEQGLVSLINHDLLDLGEENGSGLNEPVELVLVQALLCEGGGARKADLGAVGHQLVCPNRVVVLVAFHHVLGQVHAGLVVKGLPGLSVHFAACEVQLSANRLGRLASELGLEARLVEVELAAKTEMEIEESLLDEETSEENPLAVVEIHVDQRLVQISVQSGPVQVHFFLGVDVLEEFSVLPPIFAGLNDDAVRLDLFDKFLSALSQHG